MKKAVVAGVITSLILVIIVFTLVNSNNIKNKVESKIEPVEKENNMEEEVEIKVLRESDFKITQNELVERAEDDLEETKLKFQNKVISLEGKIKELGYDDLGAIYIEMEHDIESEKKILCYFDNYDDIKDLEKGEKIRLVGDVLNISKFYIEMNKSEYENIL